LKTRIKLV